MSLPHLRHRGPGFAAQFALALLACFGGGRLSMANNQPLLVIMGASYASDWKTPQLSGYTVVNKGKGGDDTSQVLARFDSEVLALKPAAVLIWGHINNYHRAGGDMESAKKKAWNDQLEMIRRARAQGVTVILGTEVTLSEAVGFVDRVAAFVGNLRGKEGYSARINKPVRTVNTWLRDYAHKEGIRVLDIEKLFDDGEGFRKTEYTTDDGSHITAEGYAELTRHAQAEFARN
jgi:lysophospholipase L1-like esterase